MAYREFDGDLDQGNATPAASGFREFDGELDPEPKKSLVDRAVDGVKAAGEALRSMPDPLRPQDKRSVLERLGDQAPAPAPAAPASAPKIAPRGLFAELKEQDVLPFIKRRQQAASDMFDPSAEARTRRLVSQGMNVEQAQHVGKRAAAAKVPVGQEPGVSRMESTDFDFATRKKFNEDPFFKNPVVRAAVKGFEGYKQGVRGLNQFAAEAVGADDLAADAVGGAKRSRDFTDAMGTPSDHLQRNFEGAVSSIAMQLPALVAGVATGSEALTLSSMFTQTFGTEYSDGRARGQTTGEATQRAALFGAFEVIGERLGLGQQLDLLRNAARGVETNALTKFMANTLTKELPGESVTTTGQFLTDKLGDGIGLNPQAGLEDYLGQMADTVTQTIMQGGMMSAGGAAINHAASKIGQRLDDGSAAADAARDAALSKWRTAGLRPTASAPAAPKATIADIGAATSVDAAIEAAQAVMAAPTASPHATPTDIDALEQGAGMAPLVPGKEVGGMLDSVLPAPAQAAPVADVGGKPEAPIVRYRREAGEIEGALPPVADGHVRLWRGNRPGEEGKATSYTNDLPGIAMPFRQSYGGDLTYVDVPESDLAGYENKVGVAAGSEFNLPPELATMARSATARQAATPTPQRDAIDAVIDHGTDWHAFPPETRTLGIPRAEMPQIKAEHRGALTQFLKARGIPHEQIEVPAEDLKPTQAEFSLDKVHKAMEYEGGERSILVSSDGHVLDGHHQWMAALDAGRPVKAIRLDAPITQLIDAAREFPSAGVDAATAAPAPQSKLEAARAKHAKQDEAVRLAAQNIAARKVTGGQRARDRVKAENPFLSFLASTGIATADRGDTGAERGRIGNPMVPGHGPVYRKSGKRLGELALLARDAGFLTEQDIEDASDTGGTRKLADMIARALQGKEVIREVGAVGQAAPDADAQLLDEAQKLGIDTAGKDTDQVYDEVVAAHAAGFTDAEAQIAAQMDDINLDGTPSELTDEEIDGIFGIRTSEGPRSNGGETEENSAGAAPGRAETVGQQGEEYALTSQSSDEIRARHDESQKRAAARQAERDKIDRQRKRAQDDAEVQRRIPGTADDFQLGQSADEALAGQRDIFGNLEERKDDPYTRDLFGGQDLFDDIDVRPGTFEAQKDAGRAAVSDLARRLGIDRINRRADPGGGEISVLGARLLANFVAGKPNQLIGQQVNSPADLAVLAQVYRDPRFETFRVFYVKAGEVVGEAGYTSRLPAAVHLPPDLDKQIAAGMERFGADGYYILHNHPSGHAQPSQADESMTVHIDKLVPGFLGHVVVDHNEYAVIQNWGSEVRKAPHLNGQDFTAIPEMEHQLLGLKLNGPDSVARAAKALQVKHGFATLILTTAPGQVNLVVDVPLKALQGATGKEGRSKTKALVRRMSREAGTGGHRFLVLPQDSLSFSPYLHLIADGILTDVVKPGGTTAQMEGAYFSGNFMNQMRGKSIRVGEGETDYDGIPVAFVRGVTVDRAGTAVPADQALEAVSTDIDNLTALLKCMRG